ncbi:MAG: hypothetical protein RI972_914, partial [Pseudomonadota bacterium]
MPPAASPHPAMGCRAPSVVVNNLTAACVLQHPGWPVANLLGNLMSQLQTATTGGESFAALFEESLQKRDMRS